MIMFSSVSLNADRILDQAAQRRNYFFERGSAECKKWLDLGKRGLLVVFGPRFGPEYLLVTG